MEEEFVIKRECFLKQFEDCRCALSAMGDNTRQLIIRALMEHTGEGGLRVGEIQENTNISRTAVSHHLKVLKDAGIIDMKKSGTKNYYFLDAKSSSIRLVADFWQTAQEMMALCPRVKEELHNEII